MDLRWPYACYLYSKVQFKHSEIKNDMAYYLNMQIYRNMRLIGIQTLSNHQSDLTETLVYLNTYSHLCSRFYNYSNLILKTQTLLGELNNAIQTLKNKENKGNEE